jgi:adenine-specific DNA-methyltransferase
MREVNTAGPLSSSLAPETLLDHVDLLRLDASRRLAQERRSAMGQFLTPSPVARLMASILSPRADDLRILDPGAGVGSLFAAAVERVCSTWERKPKRIHVVAYEIEPTLAEHLPETLRLCAAVAEDVGVTLTGEVRRTDFIHDATVRLRDHSLFPTEREPLNAAILNPPYRKINVGSDSSRLLESLGIKTSNLYSAFLWLTARLLDDGGDLVAITPRSFCNGPYFLPFRRELVRSFGFRRVHLFDSRTSAFSDDAVLQENIIFAATKGAHYETVTVSSSPGLSDEESTSRSVSAEALVSPNDAKAFIHIVPRAAEDDVRAAVEGLAAPLGDLGLSVSTGRVVDFRARPSLRKDGGRGTVPLIYATHFANGFIEWPASRGKKPNALLAEGNDDLLVPSETYVLVKRFSSKEERRRVVAAIYDPGRLSCSSVGFENHLNYYHASGRGLDPALARGLAVYLNSTLVDAYFRQFSGHTQVNATDLRSLRYPSAEELTSLGERIDGVMPEQSVVDGLIREVLMAKGKADPTDAGKKIAEALSILRALGVPREQQNDRSALVLLALLDLKPGMRWADAGSPLRGITEMMDYFREHFGVSYAPNTRETVRRQTIHQFVQIGIAVANPDNPSRAVNSPANVYRIDADVLDAIRKFGGSDWEKNLSILRRALDGRSKLRDHEREMALIPVTMPGGGAISLSAGGQSPLIKEIVEQFCPRFTPGGVVLYVGDTGEKHRHFAEDELRGLGVSVDRHGKMPDVVIHDRRRNWLILAEAVTSHGPVSLKRHNELKELFGGSSAGLVYVTAFADRRAMGKYLGEIAWETEVWVADAPSHLIHFNGERFLGPHD